MYEDTVIKISDKKLINDKYVVEIFIDVLFELQQIDKITITIISSLLISNVSMKIF